MRDFLPVYFIELIIKQTKYFPYMFINRSIRAVQIRNNFSISEIENVVAESFFFSFRAAFDDLRTFSGDRLGA